MSYLWVRRSLSCVALVVAVYATATVRAAQPSASAPAKEPRPNIIFILADDLGYGDLGCYGQSWVKTPRLDSLAREGIRFLNHYAGSTIGAPSRCCLLTGRHTGHVSVRGNAEVLMSPDEVTVAEVLKGAGYTTAAIGKWGVGHLPPPGDPNRQGFDFFYGFLDRWHAHNYFPDYLWRNESRCAIKGNVVQVIGRGGVAIKRTQYAQHLFTEEAEKFIREKREQPFFLFLAFTTPHANTEAGDEGLEVPNDIPYSAMNWPQQQKNHAAMITRLDHSVGRIVDTVHHLGLAENTLILFSSDNGPHRDGGADPEFFQSSGQLRGCKGDLHEGGLRVPLICWWPGRITPGIVSSHVSAFWDFLPTAAEVAGVPFPKDIDGISYLPTLLGDAERQRQHEFLYWECHENGSRQAVRMGNWKAIRTIGGDFLLYDLKNDPREKTNVAAANPETVKQIEAILARSRTESTLFPLKPAGTTQSQAK